MAIYTRTGDKGETGTFAGKRVPKSSQLIRTIGAIDELNSFLGIIASPAGRQGELIEIQKNLFVINAILTGAKLKFPADATRKLEKEIDKIEGRLPVQKNFLIYGGTKRAAQIYFARALARRAERELVSLSTKYSVLSTLLIYINRLSDYLFILARNINHKKGVKEIIWKPSK